MKEEYNTEEGSKEVPDWLRQRRSEYMKVFGSDAGKRVLADLKNFCLPDRTAFDPNPFVMVRNATRQEVWIHIRYCLEWDDDDLSRILKQADARRKQYE